MEKLTLKELAPYLPYNLMVLNLHTNVPYQLTGRVIDRVANLNESHKPILRPLSDLTKRIDGNDNNLRYSAYLKLWTNEDLEYCKYNPLGMDYETITKLLGWHFDIFGLLDKNLAVPVTEEFNPYK